MRPLSGSTYLNLPVLDGLFSMVGLEDDSPSRRVTLLDYGPGLPWADAHERVPRYRRTLRFQLDGRADVADLLGFFDSRFGRLKPFWLPSWDTDLTLAEAVEAASGQLSIHSPELTGYHARVYPQGASRRHLQLDAWGFATVRAQVTGIVSHGAGVATLALNDPLAEAFPDWARVCFLRHCRFDTDEARLEFKGDYAQCELPILELPNECPEALSA